MSVPKSPAEATTIVELGGKPSATGLPSRQVIEGTGALVSTPPNDDVAPPAGGDGFQLNFTDTDIAAVIAAVLGDGLNLPYVIDPQIKGNITLQATRPLTRDEVLVALESALRVQGAALIDENGVYHVVPNKDASRRVSSLQSITKGAKGFGIYIVPLQFVGAAEMEKILQPFAPEGGIQRVDEARNLLLLAGTSQEVSTLLNVVRTFDVDWLAGMSFGLFPLEYVDAKTIAGELGEIFTGSKSPINGVVRFVPLARLNSIMVVTPQAKYLKDVETWIKRLDLGSSTPGRRIYVYDVQNGKADDLAHSLSQILSIDSDTGSSSSSAYRGSGASNAAGNTGRGGLGGGGGGSRLPFGSATGGSSPGGSSSASL
ncbi:MAG: secretin N-terminal domain-containing protein, partial [Gammaproteobacteria bacterium]